MKEFLKKNLIILMVVISFLGSFSLTYAADEQIIIKSELSKLEQDITNTKKIIEQNRATNDPVKEREFRYSELKLNYLQAEYDQAKSATSIQQIIDAKDAASNIVAKKRNELNNLIGTGYGKVTADSDTGKQYAREITLLNQVIAESASAQDQLILQQTGNPTPEQIGQAEESKQNAEEARNRQNETEAGAKKEDPPEDLSCGIMSMSKCPKVWLLWSLGLIQQIVGKVLWLASALFDMSIKYSIIEIKKFADLPAISLTWTILRDFTNMFFIFGMLYIAIGTIVQYSGVNWKSMITTIIIAAIFINFSMAIVKAVVDVSNVFALFFFEATKGVGSDSISTTLMQNLGLNQYLKLSDKALINLSAVNMTATALGDIIIMLMAVFVLVSGAIMLLSRTISVLFLMALSPLPFFAMIVPQASMMSKGFWEKLMNHALFAPAYMMCLYLTMQLLACGDKIKVLLKADGSAKGGEDLFNTAIFYIIASGFMYSAIIVAKQLSGSSFEFATNIGSKVAGLLPGIAAAGGGALGRNTIGRLANLAAESDMMKKWEAYNPKIGGLEVGVGRMTTAFKDSVVKPVATSSFDARNTESAKALGKATGIDAGQAGGKGGFAATAKEEKDYGKYQKGVKTEVEEGVKIGGMEKTTGAGKYAIYQTLKDKRKVKTKELVSMSEHLSGYELGRIMTRTGEDEPSSDDIATIKKSVLSRIKNGDKDLAKYTRDKKEIFELNQSEYDEAMKAGKNKETKEEKTEETLEEKGETDESKEGESSEVKTTQQNPAPFSKESISKMAQTSRPEDQKRHEEEIAKVKEGTKKKIEEATSKPAESEESKKTREELIKKQTENKPEKTPTQADIDAAMAKAKEKGTLI